MGYPQYSVVDRSTRSTSLGYQTKSKDELFEQNRVRRIHDSMNPKGVKLRESRDSENHPNSVPIIIGLDVTGSMHDIPVYLVREGLPKMVSGIIENGVPDPQILFLGIGDSKCDNYPFQVGQFESGDAELDMWLTRTYLEGGGGGNGGESYHWAWYFAAMHTVTDAWEKRHEKGFLFTIGDERCHPILHARELQEVTGEKSEPYKTEELLARAQERYNVYHLHIIEGAQGEYTLNYWKNLLGEKCIVVDSSNKIGSIISNVVVKAMTHSSGPSVVEAVVNSENTTVFNKPNVML